MAIRRPAAEVVHVSLVNVIGDYGVRLVVLRRVAKDLDVLIVGNKHSFFVELKGLAEALGSSLTKCYEFMAQLGPCLEERGHWSTHDYLHLYRFLLLLAPNSVR